MTTPPAATRPDSSTTADAVDSGPGVAAVGVAGTPGEDVVVDRRVTNAIPAAITITSPATMSGIRLVGPEDPLF